MKPKCVSNVVKHQCLPWWIQLYCNRVFSPQTLELLLTQGRLPRYSFWLATRSRTRSPRPASSSSIEPSTPMSRSAGNFVSMHQDISKCRADAAHLPHMIRGEVAWRASNKVARVCWTLYLYLYSSLQSAGFPIKIRLKTVCRHRGTEVEYASGSHKSLAKSSPECV